MTDVFEQEPERLSTGAIWLVAAGTVAISALLIAIAWWLVVPPAAAERATAAPSPLEHGLIDRATGGEDLRAAGEHQLEHYEWVDRAARTVRIPIDRAIDAVVADPGLIGAQSRALVGASLAAPDRAGASSSRPAAPPIASGTASDTASDTASGTASGTVAAEVTR
jgi:hypothetical protein